MSKHVKKWSFLKHLELAVRRRIHLYALSRSDNYGNATADFLCAGDLSGCRKISELMALREAQTFFLKMRCKNEKFTNIK